MKAWILESVGTIEYKDCELPVLRDGEVRIKVEAAGVCGSDIPRIYETGAHSMPLVPGHEFAGVVDDIGTDVDSRWSGKRVAIFPKIPCGKCSQCVSGNSDMCTSYDYVGSRRNGAFAEYVNVPARNLLELPDKVTFEQAAMIEPLAVAANSVRTGFRLNQTLNKDDTVVVCGAGTIGIMVIMFLLEAGFSNIYVIGNKDSQKNRVITLGIAEDRFVNSCNVDINDYFGKLLGGVKLYYECVGSNESIRYGFDICAPKGVVALVGNPRSDMDFDRDTYWKILRNQLTLRGIWNSVFRQPKSLDDGEKLDDWNYVLKKLEEGIIHPEKLITHSLALDELEMGLLVMRDKTEDYCKVMVRNA